MLRHPRWKGFQEPTIEEIAENPDAYYMTEARRKLLEEFIKERDGMTIDEWMQWRLDHKM